MKFWSLSLTILALACAIFLPNWRFYSMTGRFKPVHIVETLKSPVAIREMTKAGLITADGKILSLPDVPQLPDHPSVQSDILSHGVEMATDGTVYGLLQIHHWGRNDPVRQHLSQSFEPFLVLLQETNPTDAMIDLGKRAF
jgi:hypothetical protein